MGGFMLGRPWDAVAKSVAAVGAINLGLSKFFGLDVLTYIPGGSMGMNIAVGAIALSGVYVIQLVLNKKI